MIALIVIISIAIVLGVALEMARTARLRKLSSQTCTGRLWRRAFPGVPKQTIRGFLDAVVLAFLLRKRHRLAFSPSVKILDLYRAVTADGTHHYELETLAQELQRRFAVDLFDHWNADLTLGDALALCIATKSRPA